MLDKTWPTPKELARAINEVLPTESHLAILEAKIDSHNKEPNTRKKYNQELKEELIKDTFKLEVNLEVMRKTK